jgi:hypothetical protein
MKMAMFFGGTYELRYEEMWYYMVYYMIYLSFVYDLTWYGHMLHMIWVEYLPMNFRTSVGSSYPDNLIPRPPWKSWEHFHGTIPPRGPSGDDPGWVNRWDCYFEMMKLAQGHLSHLDGCFRPRFVGCKTGLLLIRYMIDSHSGRENGR